MPKRIKPGDVLEVSTADGQSIYLCYAGKHGEYGDAVYVAPTRYAEPKTEFSGVFADSYLAFYPATAAVSRGLAAKVGHAELGGSFPPARLRRAGARSGTRVDTWIIESGGTSQVRHQLSEEERRIPIAAIWNHEFLLQKVAENWRPEQEG